MLEPRHAKAPSLSHTSTNADLMSACLALCFGRFACTAPALEDGSNIFDKINVTNSPVEFYWDIAVGV